MGDADCIRLAGVQSYLCNFDFTKRGKSIYLLKNYRLGRAKRGVVICRCWAMMSSALQRAVPLRSGWRWRCAAMSGAADFVSRYRMDSLYKRVTRLYAPGS